MVAPEAVKVTAILLLRTPGATITLGHRPHLRLRRHRRREIEIGLDRFRGAHPAGDELQTFLVVAAIIAETGGDAVAVPIRTVWSSMIGVGGVAIVAVVWFAVARRRPKGKVA